MDPQVTAAVAAYGPAWIAAGRAAWPAIQVDEARFVDHVASRLTPGAENSPVAADDLWLVCACLDHDPAALRALDDQFAALRPLLAAMKLGGDQIDELVQELRKRLVVGDGEGEDGRPRLADYSGRADLRTWLRTAATRAAIDVLRRRQDEPLPDDDEALALPALHADPELAALKARYREPFREAVIAAIAALSPRDRALLRFHYLQGYPIDRIGAVYQVHRATAARWLVLAREALAASTLRRLVAALGVTTSEVQSIARLVESQLELSIGRLFDGDR